MQKSPHAFTMDGLKAGSQKTIFHCCSDKVLKWNVLGLTGSLLSEFIEPLYFDSIVVLDNGKTPLDENSQEKLSNAFFGRLDERILMEELEAVGLDKVYRLNQPKVVYYKAEPFEGVKDLIETKKIIKLLFYSITKKLHLLLTLGAVEMTTSKAFKLATLRKRSTNQQKSLKTKIK